MNNRISLCRISVGKSAYVKEISQSCRIRKRLEELGLVVGTKVICLFASPMGGMRAYLFRGAVIALRDEDCEGVIATVEDGDAEI